LFDEVDKVEAAYSAPIVAFKADFFGGLRDWWHYLDARGDPPVGSVLLV
jgi:hypothetical protein